MIRQLRGCLIVSCQAQPHEPLFGLMDRLAIAAIQGGAKGIRTEGQDIEQIRAVTDLPIIGLTKRHYEGFEPYITPTLSEADRVIELGADIVAVDCTNRPRPDGSTIQDAIQRVHAAGKCFMADISTLSEGLEALKLGADCVSTTLSGYTPYTKAQDGPDWQLLQDLVKETKAPVIMEGRVWDPAQARKALELGAWAVVVGSAITRPWLVVERYVQEMHRE